MPSYYLQSYYLDTTGRALVDPLVKLWNSFATALPGLLAALVVVIIGYVVASAFGFMVHKLLDKSRVDQQLKRAGLAHSIGFISVSTLSGALVKWYIFTLFLLPAADFLEFGVLSSLLKEFALWVPNLIIAVIIFLFGLVLADFAADKLLHAKRKGVKLISGLVRWVVIIFVGLMALGQIGVNVELATNTTLILMAGVALGAGAAIGIGFGLALKDEAKNILKHIKKAF